jgi:hypothetical protein
MVNQYLPPVILIPSSLLVTAITQSAPMIVTVVIGNTTTEANTYIVGMAVRLFVPKSYGMYQANNLVGTINAINGSNFTLSLDSSLFDAFVIPSGNVETPASIGPNGSRNLEYDNRTSNIVPFHNLNNFGN